MKYNINESIEKIVEDMRKLTMLTGQLSSVHEETLYMWPLILFNNIEKIEIKYDLTKEYTQEAGEGYIIYKIDILPENIPGDDLFYRRCEMLADWVRNMLWNDIKVEIETKTKGYSNSSKDKKHGLEQN